MNRNRVSRKLYGAIRLFRVWNLQSCSLRSLVVAFDWMPDVNVSFARVSTSGGRLSDKGFYGFKSYGTLLESDRPYNHSQIAGTILCWGKVVVAERGARCQKAKVESLIVPNDEIDLAVKAFPVAEKYHARVISEETAHQLVGGLVPYQFEDVT